MSKETEKLDDALIELQQSLRMGCDVKLLVSDIAKFYGLRIEFLTRKFRQKMGMEIADYAYIDDKKKRIAIVPITKLHNANAFLQSELFPPSLKPVKQHPDYDQHCLELARKLNVLLSEAKELIDPVSLRRRRKRPLSSCH